MLGLLRVLALAALVMLIFVQRLAYTIVAELPTKPGDGPAEIGYVGVGSPGEDVDIICPIGIEFLEADHLGIVETEGLRLLDLDLDKRAVASARPITIDSAALPEAVIAGGGQLWMWVHDTTGRTQAALPLFATRTGSFAASAVETNAVARFAPASDVQRRLSDLGFPAGAGNFQAAGVPPSGNNTEAALAPSRSATWSETVTSAQGQSTAVTYAIAGTHDVRIEVAVAGGQTKTFVATEKFDVVSAQALTTDSNGNVFVAVTSIDKSAPALAIHEAVYKLSDSGAKPTIYDVPLEGGDCVARQHVAVSAAGDVYFLRVTNERVAVLKLGQRSIWSMFFMPYSNLRRETAAWKEQFAALDGRGIPGLSAAAYDYVQMTPGGNISRRDVLHNACEYLNHTWPVSDANLTTSGNLCGCSSGNSGCKRWKAPDRLNGRAGTTVSSLPYNWGGADKLDQFDDKIKNLNRPAGQVCTPTKGGDVIADSGHTPNDTLPGGVDCSGFVTRAWGWPGSGHPYGTSTLHTIADPLTDKLDLRPGDVLNDAGSHVRMVLNWRGHDKVEIIESATFSGGVGRRILLLTQLNDYKPMRAKHVVTGPALTVDDMTCVPN